MITTLLGKCLIQENSRSVVYKIYWLSYFFCDASLFQTVSNSYGPGGIGSGAKKAPSIKYVPLPHHELPVLIYQVWPLTQIICLLSPLH